MKRLVLMLTMLMLASSAAAFEARWIADPAAAPAPVVLHFRKDVQLEQTPEHLWVDVSADNRFILYVNGQRVAAGPATSDLSHWRYREVDIAPYLKSGRNTLAAVVWNFVTRSDDGQAQREGAVQTGPLSQSSVGTGFYLKAKNPVFAGLDSGPTWRVRRDDGHLAESGQSQINTPDYFGYYVAGEPEIIDANRLDWNWQTAPLTQWESAVLAADQASRVLGPDPLPAMTYTQASAGQIVRGGTRFPVTVPAHTRTAVLIRRDDMISAYPSLTVSGGKNATIKLTYAEALLDKDGHKGIRDEVGDRHIRGLVDTFTTDGERRTFAPLHWRVWRFLQIEVTTGDAPVVLEDLNTVETRYPFVRNGYFDADDSELNRIWQIGWNTAIIDAHETYMDSAYWEQLQYVGDTRLQALISYSVSGDSRLAVNAIDAFGWSNSEGGLTEGAYPSRGSNVIAPFSLLWIGMMHDWWWHQPDTAVIQRNLPRAREVLAWFRPYVHPNGLLGRNPTWNFVDWVGKAREDFPSFDQNEESCLTTLFYIGALRQAAELENAMGDPAQARDNAALAQRMTVAVQTLCWDEGRQLFADDPSKTLFSQHTNSLAVLYDVAPPDKYQSILLRVTASGIDAPDGIIPSSYYFSWYLVRAYEHAGLSDRYIALLQTWRDLLPLNLTTWPEDRIGTRSDTHAWSGHPTADLLAVVAGIGPGAPGYATVRIAPHLGKLTHLKARAQTPYGPVIVVYRVEASGLIAEITSPLAGDFVWQGRTHPIRVGVTKLERIPKSVTHFSD